MLLDDVVDGSAPRSVIMSEPLPDGVRVVEFRGPLFFGATARLDVALKTLRDWPGVIIIRLREVPLVDSTGIDALEQLARLARQHGCRIIISGLQAQPREALHRYGSAHGRGRAAQAPARRGSQTPAGAVRQQGRQGPAR
jgi:SulP family sulfate permease